MDKPKIARPLAQIREGRTDWYRIVNHGPGQPADIYVYDEIGYWGVMAAEFVAELAQVTSGDITLHLNSPGGDVFDGIAIMQSLRDHPATVTVKVDALAASIASVIAMAGDRIVMGRNAQMMIHDASGLCIGNSADMAQMLAMLDKVSDNIASVYADRAGGTAASWRTTMKAETWYSADEAVAAGLADEVAPLPAKEEAEALAAVAKWDLSIYAYAGRDKAPAPAAPAAVVEPEEETEDTPVAALFDPDLFKAAMADQPRPRFDTDLFRTAMKEAAAR